MQPQKNLKNYLPRSFINPKLKVGPSAIDGKGVFTTEDIKKGEILMIWGGVLIDRKEYETTWRNYRDQTIIQIDEQYYLGLPIEEKESIDEYLNHSCDPNSWLTDEVTLVARRTIKAGEEITTDSAMWNDYELEDYTDNGVCTCQSPLCRKVLTGHDWQDPTLQERYNRHFSPYIQKWIDQVKASQKPV